MVEKGLDINSKVLATSNQQSFAEKRRGVGYLELFFIEK